MSATRRRLLQLSGAATILAACQQPSGAAGAKGKYEIEGDMALGDPNAPATLIEYASITCSHCREFHEEVWPALKANYVDQGKLRFVFREFPTAPAQIAVAGFQIARCNNATAEQYFNRVDVLFAQQIQIFEALQQGQARDSLLNIAKSAGLTEEQFTACVSDPAGVKRIQATVEKATKDYNIEGTPTLILNGEKLTDAAVYTYDGLAKVIDAKLGGA